MRSPTPAPTPGWWRQADWEFSFPCREMKAWRPSWPGSALGRPAPLKRGYFRTGKAMCASCRTSRISGPRFYVRSRGRTAAFSGWFSPRGRSRSSARVRLLSSLPIYRTCGRTAASSLAKRSPLRHRGGGAAFVLFYRQVTKNKICELRDGIRQIKAGWCDCAL